jgi:hypothetical protein
VLGGQSWLTAWRPLELSWDANFQPKPHGDVADEPLGCKMARMDIPRKVAHVFVIARAAPTKAPLACAAQLGPAVAPQVLLVFDDKFRVSTT